MGFASACNTTQSGATTKAGESTAADGTVDLTMAVANGKPVGGLHEWQVKTGAHVVITVTTTDTTNRVHLHGYDILKPLSPTQPGVIDFTAKITGVFEVELEDTSTKIIDLTVD